MPPTAGLRRGPSRPTAGMLAVREHTGCAVLRCDQGGDDRRSVALFGIRAVALGDTHSIGCRALFRVLCDRDTRPTCSRSALHPCNNTFGIGPNARRVSLATPDAAGGPRLQLRQCWTCWLRSPSPR